MRDDIEVPKGNADRASYYRSEAARCRALGVASQYNDISAPVGRPGLPNCRAAGTLILVMRKGARACQLLRAPFLVSPAVAITLREAGRLRNTNQPQAC